MHGAHYRENDFPVCPPGRCPVHLRRFLERHRDIDKITGIQQNIHRHVKHDIQDNHTEPVCQPHLRRLLCQRHHQDCERNKHTTHDKQIDKAIKLAVALVSAECITHYGVNRYGQHHRQQCNHHTVFQRVPEVGHAHCLFEIIKTPCPGKGQNTADTVCHLRRLLKCDNNCHVQWERNCRKT